MQLLLRALLCAILGTSAIAAQEIHVTWNGMGTTLDSYPTELSSSRQVDTIVTQVNDYVFDYTQTLQGTQQTNSGPQDLINIIIAGAGDTKKHYVPPTCKEYRAKVEALTAALKGSKSLTLTASSGKLASVSLAASQADYRNTILPKLQDLGLTPTNATDEDCTTAASEYAIVKKQLEKMAAADKGDHTIRGIATLTPGYDYKLTINETYGGTPTDASPRQFTFSPTNNAVTVSAGFALTWLQSRSYTSVTVPDPATSSTATKTILSTGDMGAPRPILLALLNYNLIVPKKPRFGDFNLGISAGPVLQAGGKSDLATLGVFTGVSVSFLHNLYITPGVHIGQYADPPPGLVQGATIPAGLGTLVPVKSWKPAFSLGITFRATSIGSKQVGAKDTTPTR